MENEHSDLDTKIELPELNVDEDPTLTYWYEVDLSELSC